MNKHTLTLALFDEVIRQQEPITLVGREGTIQAAPYAEAGNHYTVGVRLRYSHDCGVITIRSFYQPGTMAEEFYRFVSPKIYKLTIWREYERLIGYGEIRRLA